MQCHAHIRGRAAAEYGAGATGGHGESDHRSAERVSAGICDGHLQCVYEGGVDECALRGSAGDRVRGGLCLECANIAELGIAGEAARQPALIAGRRGRGIRRVDGRAARAERHGLRRIGVVGESEEIDLRSGFDRRAAAGIIVG